MPAALPIDWNHAKLLRFQGLTYPEIAERMGISVGVVSVRASREKWAKAATAARETVIRGVVQVAAHTLQERAATWTEACAKDLEKSVRHLSSIKKPKRIRELRDLEETWAVHTKRGRATFGLDSVTPATVNIGIVTSVGEVVEVQSEVIPPAV